MISIAIWAVTKVRNTAARLTKGAEALLFELRRVRYAKALARMARRPPEQTLGLLGHRPRDTEPPEQHPWP